MKKLLNIVIYISISAILSGCAFVGAQKPAALQVTSNPEASVFLDGKHLGKTPYFSDQLDSGTHTLKITVSEANYVEKINLFEGALTVVNRDLAQNFLAQSGETLWLDKGKKGLLIVTTPNQSDITIDGVYKGKSPLLIDKIEAGDHKVVVAKENYENREFTIKILSKYQLVADVFLASIQAKNVNNQNQEQEVEIKVEKIKVQKTPQGFLRVRKEPSLSSSEIGRVNDGAELEVIQQTEDWVKIIFAEKQGWISNQ